MGKFVLIFEAFGKLAYPKHFLDKLHRVVRKTFYSGPRELLESEQIPTLVIPYTDFSERVVRPTLARNPCRSVHRYANTLKRKLIKTRPPRTLNDTSGDGAHRIPCREWDEVYIGQTGRDLKVKLGSRKLQSHMD